MNDLSMMLSSQRKYKNLKSNINTIVANLNSAIENLEIPANKISSFYNIDSVGIDSGKLNSTRQDLIKKRDYLRNVILVEIDRKLRELNRSIEGMG